MSNELTTLEQLIGKTPNEIVAVQTNEEKARTYIALDMLDDLKEAEKAALKKEGAGEYTWTLPNGIVKVCSVTKGGTRTVKEVKTTVDKEGLLALAKQNGWEIPTKTEIDWDKLEQLPWYQENESKFCKDTVVEREVKSNDVVKVKNVNKK